MTGHLRTLGEGTLRAYAQILFSSRLDVGAILMLASFVVPSVGLVGLGGAALAGGLALALGFDREAVRSGALGYNALLVFLGLGAMVDRSPAFCGLALVAAGGTVLVHAATSAALSWHLRLPALSVPFVVSGWLVLACVPHLRGMALRHHPPAVELGPFPGPAWVGQFLTSLGGIFFQPHWIAGAVVAVALLRHSRIGLVHALVGFGVGQLAERHLLALQGPGLQETAGFNLVLTSVVLGGVYYVPGPASLALAASGALAAALLSVAMGTLLAPVGMPVLAAPFNLITLGTLYALAQRTRQTAPRPTDRVGVSPEEVLGWYRARVHRFHLDLPVRLQLPFRGAWTCTQGNDGPHTHQGLWRHGLDFEVLDETGQRGGPSLADHGCWHLPVLAPAAGTVVRVVDGVADNAPGAQDTEERWGNLVVVQHAPALFSLVAHLSPATIAVRVGDYVLPGQLLGRCGSSGRSPVPHLHFQLQATPEPGDPTTGVSLPCASPSTRSML
ncbi:MAG TPA: urea transporter, partial [Myxococcota bacterium]|nr:urea transporter [Myxococcota bacterium]